ncbi:MAG TPA: hypothetical protein VIV06_08020 [Candidatus Limnocylindrales bacterium]
MGFGRRRMTPPSEAAVDDLVLRIRWERAKKRYFEPGSVGWMLIERREDELIQALHHRVGLENVTQPALEWLITRTGTPGMRRPGRG